ncbi:hypothetical protein BGX31_010072 [Mortierella sp. GBA43]|nr:hypothetical protein BGX31_010072 [Mortierella sp. GBA43]
MTQPSQPHVLIVGAGLAGVLLAILLEQIDIPYQIYERAAVVKPLGSAMALGPNILPIFEQLGMLDDVKKISKPYRSVDMYSQDIKLLGHIEMHGHDKLVGYESIVFARPMLYDLMLSKVPRHKLHLNKRVERTEEKDGKSLYEKLDKERLLPKADLKGFDYACVNMVGVSEPQDPSIFPELKDEKCHFTNMTGDTGDRGWTIISTPNNQICWVLGEQLPKKLTEQQRSTIGKENAEWAPDSIEAMYEKFRNEPIPWGKAKDGSRLTMATILDSTPKDRISKVLIEDKVFKTWYHGQTVLIGDGAVNAMHDAVVLANCIYNMRGTSSKSITAALKEYYNQRYHRLEAHFKRSRALTSVFGGKTWIQRTTRHMLLNYIPKRLQERDFVKSMEYRPQVAWLPLVPNRGKGHVLPQEGKRELLQDRKRRLELEKLGIPDLGQAIAL